MMVRPGVKSSSRTSSAKMPPSMKAVIVLQRYMTPMRLWSSVVSHDQMPFSALM